MAPLAEEADDDIVDRAGEVRGDRCEVRLERVEDEMLDLVHYCGLDFAVFEGVEGAENRPYVRVSV